jgi:hypothetical protein
VASIAQTAGAETAATGVAINLSALGPRYNAGAVAVGTRATMASGGSLAVAVTIQDSANNSDWATVVAATEKPTNAAVAAAQTDVVGGAMYNVDLSTCRQYVRAIVLPNFSATATDTALALANWVFAYPDRAG